MDSSFHNPENRSARVGGLGPAMPRVKVVLAVAGAVALLLGWTGAPENPFVTRFHLTAQPWQPVGTPQVQYLDAIEGVCRFSARHQNRDGAIIDPFLHREFQYATPYFAYAVGTLASAGRAKDLLPRGIRAMEHATLLFAGGRDSIPDQHGEFFIPALTEALDLYEHHVPRERLAAWRERLRLPVERIIRGPTGNWQTYAMKGQWVRAQAGLIPRANALATIEDDWRSWQRGRFACAPWFLYHDKSSDPDTLSVEAVGRGNLLALIELGYDGPSAAAIRQLVEAGTRTTLWLQDPSGQVPANGRTDDHVWVDVGYMLSFEVMAERSHRQQDSWLAGQYRHAALLALQSIQRWRRADPPWEGSYSVTKNHFDPALRVGYQTASAYSNYSGSLMFHLSEAYRVRKSAIEERPTPAEIGGYAFALDASFATAFANAGGMQLQANLRGDPGPSSGNYWTPLGVVRFARAGWDTRLGPSDGALTSTGGVTYAPTFVEEGRWLKMADLSSRYEAEFRSGFVSPALVRCSIVYRPRSGEAGPTFRDDFTLTPDGILSEMQKTSTDAFSWGVTWPLLENDGRPLELKRSAQIASTGYGSAGDSENFISVNATAPLDFSEEPLRSTYGDLRPVRMVAPGRANRTFVYPANTGQPPARAVWQSFRMDRKGFHSVLGSVHDNVYVGHTVAGGEANQVDLDGDGKPDLKFSEKCMFLAQMRDGVVVAIEVDRPVQARVRGRLLRLSAYIPLTL